MHSFWVNEVQNYFIQPFSQPSVEYKSFEYDKARLTNAFPTSKKMSACNAILNGHAKFSLSLETGVRHLHTVMNGGRKTEASGTYHAPSGGPDLLLPNSAVRFFILPRLLSEATNTLNCQILFGRVTGWPLVTCNISQACMWRSSAGTAKVGPRASSCDTHIAA